MQFDFGKNWLDFSKNSLNLEKIQQAKKDFQVLFDEINMQGKTFVDIGFGQGLSLFLAKQRGALVIGCDVNATCREALAQTLTYFPQYQVDDIPLVIGSILHQAVIDQLKLHTGNIGFDIVHSWGVLHHTGNMQMAMRHAASLVKPKGLLVVAIYNRHWTSLVWLSIKWLYCKLPWMRLGLLYILYPIVWLAKYAVTGENPTKMTRGMDFFYNLIDWVGGYPYEYATRDEIDSFLQPLGFKLIHFFPAKVPTGCNEFIFVRT